MIPEFPSPVRVPEYVCDLEYLFSRMNVGSYGPKEPHMWLVSKIPTRTWDDCRTTSERKSRPCHAPHCDHRSGCVLQPKRQQHTRDGKTVTQEDHFWCIFTCGYCGKRRHYEDECQIKNVRVANTNGRKLSARKPKHPPELPRMGIRLVKEEAREVARVETQAPRGAHQRPLFLPLLPSLTPRSVHSGITPPLTGLTPRRGGRPRWPSPSWLQGLK